MLPLTVGLLVTNVNCQPRVFSLSHVGIFFRCLTCGDVTTLLTLHYEPLQEEMNMEETIVTKLTVEDNMTTTEDSVQTIETTVLVFNVFIVCT